MERLSRNTCSTNWRHHQEEIGYLRVTAIPPADIPASVGSGTRGQLGVSVENIIKLIWRPRALTVPGAEVFRNVHFQTVPQGIKACNPGRYYLSFNRLRVDGALLDLNALPSMLAPGECVLYPVKGNTVSWSVIDDYGGDSGEYSATLSG
ncbi:MULTISPECIES: fimbrial biogenesis chaperone [unclassified Erwinia]|uniref:fimbrial biogenesis chaperone n=1 Tax=unclassified Erwinia TaxID=2622719 RepID=UPI0013041348